jgi:hypothetical protein
LSLFSSSFFYWRLLVHHIVSLRPSTTLSLSFCSRPSSLGINPVRYFRLQGLYSEFIFPPFPQSLSYLSFYFVLLKSSRNSFISYSRSMTESSIRSIPC